MYDIRKANAWWAIGSLVLMLIGMCLLCASCSIRSATGPVGAPTGCDSPASNSLISLGRTFIWAGGIAAFVGIIARFAFKPFSALGTAVAEVGIVALVFGVCFAWLGTHLWVIAVACGCALLAAAYHRRTELYGWYLAWKNHTK